MTQPEAARVERGPITEVKRFALGMADLLERQGFTIAAAELRRLHAENEAFGIHLSERMKDLARVEAQRDALLEACKAYDKWADKTHCYDRELRPIRAQIRAAIKAAEENT